MSSWIGRLILLASACAILQASVAQFPQRFRHNVPRAYRRKPTNSPQRLDSILRSEFQNQIKDKFREVEQNFKELIHALTSDYETELRKLKNACLANTKASENVVAFQLYASGAVTAREQKVIFDKALVNTGDSFNMSSASFTAPAAGIYSFNLAYVTQSHCPALSTCLQLVINGQDREDYCQDNSGSSSRTSLVELAAGDVVHVTSHALVDSSAPCTINDGDVMMRVNFSGHIIK